MGSPISLCSRWNTPVSLARSPAVSPKRIIGRSCSYNCCVKRDRQAFEAKQKTSLEQLWRLIAHYPQIGQLLDDHRQRDRGLHARKGRADTEMNTIPKRYMPVRCACNIKALRLCELLGIPVSRCQPGEDQLILWNGHSRDADRFPGRAPQTPDRRGKAQNLLNRPRHQFRLPAYLLQRLGMLIKAANGLTQQIRRRDVPGEQQHSTEADRILHVQVFAIDLGGQQFAHHILAWRALALL